MLIIREDLSKYPRPKEELETIINAHVDWAKSLSERKIFVDGNGLNDKGRLVEMIDGKITESPLRDIKEGVGGYYIIAAENLDEAVHIAKECPTYSSDDLIEVRPIGP